MKSTVALLLLVLSLSTALQIYKDTNPRPLNYVAHRVKAGAIRIDGKLDDVAWQEVPFTSNFVDIQGASQPTPRYNTNVKMRFDDEFLYFGAYLQEPNLVATINVTNSVIFNDNDFEIFINPSGNLHFYNEFEMNALNYTWTLVEINPYRDGFNIINPYVMWGYQTAVWLNGTLNDPSDVDSGWSVEVALPMSMLKQFAEKIVPKDKDQWRINFSRVEYRYKVVDGKYVKITGIPEDNWVWSPQQVIDMHQPERWGFLQFSDAQPGQTEFQFDELSYDTQQVLSWLYRAQKDFGQKHNCTFAKSFSQLDISQKSFETSLGATAIDPRIRLYETALDDLYNFEVTVLHKMDSTKDTVWHMRGDSKQYHTSKEC